MLLSPMFQVVLGGAIGLMVAWIIARLSAPFTGIGGAGRLRAWSGCLRALLLLAGVMWGTLKLGKFALLVLPGGLLPAIGFGAFGGFVLGIARVVLKLRSRSQAVAAPRKPIAA
jgi:hypothetical protein